MAKKIDAPNSPTVWMFIWERARNDGDVAAEEKAKRELKRLGVLVGESASSRGAVATCSR